MPALHELLDLAETELRRGAELGDDNSRVSARYTLVTNQENGVASYASGFFAITRRPLTPLLDIRFRDRTDLLFSDRFSPLGCPPPAPNAFDTRPSTRFAGDRADDVSIALTPPRLTFERPSGWTLRLTLHRWSNARVEVPLSDGPAGVAVGAGAGIGGVAEAYYVLNVDAPRLVVPQNPR